MVLGAGRRSRLWRWLVRRGNTPDHQLEALRRSVIRLGGEMTLLKRAAGSTVPAWVDRPSRPLIEAVKRQFDPKLQLSRGRLPGVNQETL